MFVFAFLLSQCEAAFGLLFALLSTADSSLLFSTFQTQLQGHLRLGANALILHGLRLRMKNSRYSSLIKEEAILDSFAGIKHHASLSPLFYNYPHAIPF